MLHGDLVTLTNNGIIVHQKALQSAGIYDQSLCWGVWVANPHKNHGQFKRPNLVISPFHPSSWPFLIRLEILLFDVKGAFARIAEFISDHDLSILFAQCSPTGFRHVTLVVVAVSTSESIQYLKDEKEKFDEDNPRLRYEDASPDPGLKSQAQDIANRIAAVMLIQALEIEASLSIERDKSTEVYKKSLSEGGDPYKALEEEDCCSPIYDRIKLEMAEGTFLYDKVKVIQAIERSNSAASFLEGHMPQSVKVHYMQRLAYFSIYGGGREVPFSLRYDAPAALLRLEKEGIFSEAPLELATFPAPAIVTFNSADKYIRVNPVRPEIVKLARVDIEYRIRERHRDTARVSKGLLGSICREFWHNDLNLVHISNKWTSYEYAEESGLISAVADISAHSNPKEVEDAIGVVASRNPFSNVIIKSLTVKPYAMNRLFVSLHTGHPREKNLRKMVREVAIDAGFEDAYVDTYVTPATRKVLDEIELCNSFLQLLSFRAEEDPESMSFSWLDFEYGVAAGRGMPSIRLVDVVRRPYSWWQGKIVTNIDQRPKFFRSDVCDSDMKVQLREAVEELAAEIAKRQE